MLFMSKRKKDILDRIVANELLMASYIPDPNDQKCIEAWTECTLNNTEIAYKVAGRRGLNYVTETLISAKNELKSRQETGENK